MSLLEFFKVLCLGVVEGITEWLPISSTGHLILFDTLLHLDVSDEFWNMFMVVIQLGAILSVVYLYFDKLNLFSRRKTYSEKRSTAVLWAKVIVACIPAGVLGILFDDWMDEHLRGYSVVAWALIIYGIFFILMEKYNNHRKREFRIQELSEISYMLAFGIGCFQVLSLVPGTSRSGSTILGAMLLGVNRRDAAEFSFFLAIPTIFGATVYDLWKSRDVLTATALPMISVGFVVSFFSALVVVRWLLHYVSKHDFSAFGWYRIFFGGVILLTWWTGLVQW